MAPIRRYLRITKYSVLEVRIYLDNPSHSETWLLRRSDPALPRIIEAVRPLVLPKLREENERSKGKGKGKGRGVKDVVVQDDFEVSIFLTDLSTRHSLLTKQKHFGDKPRLKSNSVKLTGWLTTGTVENPMEVGEDEAAVAVRSEDVEEPINLDDIPEAGGGLDDDEEGDAVRSTSRAKRRRKDSEEELFVNDASPSEDEGFQTQHTPAKARKKRKGGRTEAPEEDAAAGDDKKKMAMNTVYDGFSIYGRILCLVVKRRGGRATTSGAMPAGSGQQMMEQWVSTQAAQEQNGVNEDEG
ncbi:hypothetical protein LTS18_012529 [Coniosporium uncinatum]|uniref:Uncharacterized protein n=1 Tax=Coniosporium uncinatum TaxID=93489 RepID=A0ACC3DVM1_9PEZI|nr:hypothetical protein LTS18_012529 [Coniosporium uncinatum]